MKFVTDKFLSYSISILAISCAPTALADSGKSAAEVAKELANPNANIGFLAFPVDYVSYQGNLPEADDKTAYKISAQPSLPYKINDKWKFFVRPLIPLIVQEPVFKVLSQPDAQGRNYQWDYEGVDLGDISFDMAFGTELSHGVQFIGGVTGLLPTATNDAISLNQYLLGPEVFLGQKTSWGFYGLLAQHQWDVGGSNDESTSITGGQYFFTYDLKDAWQIQMQPTWSYNHKVPNDDRWTFPLAIGLSKVVKFGETPWKFSLQYWNFVASPDNFGPDYQVRFQFAPVIPLPW